jgi:phospholipid/cholesterol/gamma-HCH transport system ATP-binding protein
MDMSIVVVTHEFESASKIADRITVLDKGTILMVGAVDEVRNSHIPRVRNLLSRTSEELLVDSDDYLQRLTCEAD